MKLNQRGIIRGSSVRICLCVDHGEEAFDGSPGNADALRTIPPGLAFVCFTPPHFFPKRFLQYKVPFVYSVSP
jgi:hypothetical protein